jgi:hypothetical protein
MTDLNLSSINRAMTEPFSLAETGKEEEEKEREKAKAMTSWATLADRLKWFKVWWLGQWNDRTYRAVRHFFLGCWLGFPAFLGLLGGIGGDFRGGDSDLRPYTHHYQIALPTFDVGHYLGTKLRHFGQWFTE